MGFTARMPALNLMTFRPEDVDITFIVLYLIYNAININNGSTISLRNVTQMA